MSLSGFILYYIIPIDFDCLNFGHYYVFIMFYLFPLHCLVSLQSLNFLFNYTPRWAPLFNIVVVSYVENIRRMCIFFFGPKWLCIYAMVCGNSFTMYMLKVSFGQHLLNLYSTMVYIRSFHMCQVNIYLWGVNRNLKPFFFHS